MMFQITLIRLNKLWSVARSPKLLKALVWHGVLVGAEHGYVLSKQFATVVDVGANRGQFALAARYSGSNSNVISFEPLPEPAARFLEVFVSDDQVTLHQVAIGVQIGEAMIHVSQSDDSSSLLPITETQDKLFPGTAEASTEIIRVSPLDEIMPGSDIVAPALLKLDVQGFELESLKGCETLLPRFSFVYVECSFMELYEGQALADEVIAWLLEREFNLEGVYNIAYDKHGKAIQADFLFERR